MTGLRIKLATVSGSLVLAILAGYLANAVEPIVSAENLQKTRESLPLTLLGQLRITFDDYLWLKTEDYLHFGITKGSYSSRALSKSMAEAFQTRTGRAGGNTTRKPHEERNWRGFFAELELFHPAKGNHGDPRELLPWYRIQTAINPADTAAYVNGAFFLADFAKKPDEALSFLQQGAKNNPDSIEIFEAIGRLYFEKWKDYDQAIVYLKKAVALGKDRKRNDAEEDAFEKAYLFLARAYREQGDLDAALETAEAGVGECRNPALIQVIQRVVLRDIAERQERAN